MSLGQQIKKYRKTLGLTLDQLSELSNVPPGTISALTVRNSVKSTYASTLAKNGFGLSIDDIDKTIEVVVLKWERQISNNKRASG